MPVFAVEYTYDARADERAAVRPAHREFLAGLLERGTCSPPDRSTTDRARSWSSSPTRPTAHSPSSTPTRSARRTSSAGGPCARGLP
ncbi:hypothetical protein [Litorihabitans aurantiacus]|uniref:hypothetical protein n=1 Tax=Litorihabitans aurantiacus TaxID=1930061 RepID=UPI0032AFED9A